jgi:hypothetical protein
VNQQARYLTERLDREGGADVEKRIDRAFRLVVCRAPTAREVRLLLDYLERKQQDGLPQESAWQQVCRVILNLNEFVYPD